MLNCPNPSVSSDLLLAFKLPNESYSNYVILSKQDYPLFIYNGRQLTAPPPYLFSLSR